MRTSSFLGVIGLIAAEAENLFYIDQKLAAEVDSHAKDLADKPKWENPIYLDAIKNELLPNKMLTTFKSPHFLGFAPPGITTFMASQVILSGERKNGFVYPLWLKYAIEDFDGKSRHILMEDLCNKYGKKACPPGYKKVIVNPNGRDEEAEKAEKAAAASASASAVTVTDSAVVSTKTSEASTEQ